MIYKKEDLLNNFEQNPEKGQTDKIEFVRRVANLIIDNWTEQEKGQELYRQSGPFWEVLYPILKKFAPEKLKKYSAIVGDFTYFNPQVLKLVNYEDDFYNLLASLKYISERDLSYQKPTDIHLVNLGQDNIIPYLPNQSIDADEYWGREEN